MMENHHGTAGAPMLELLRAKNLCQVLVVVTRYFGGILLGTGGLVRAYAGVTKQALEQANYVEKQQGKEVQICLTYEEIEPFRYYCKKHQIHIIKEEYWEYVYFFIELPNTTFQNLQDDLDQKNVKVTKIDKITEKYI